MGWMLAPPMGVDIKDLTGELRQWADRVANVPDIVRGEAKSGTPAWGMAQLLMSARRIYDPIANNAAISHTERAKHVMQIIQHVHKEPITVLSSTSEEGKKRAWLELGPNDINGYYGVNAEIVTLTEDRRIQMGQFGAQMHSEGAISMRGLREEYLMIAAPEEMEKEVKKEQIRNSKEWADMVFSMIRLRVEDKRRQAAEQAGAQFLPLSAANPQQPGVLAGQLGMMPPVMSQPMQPGMPEQGMAAIPGAPSPQAPTPGVGLPVSMPMQGPVV